jgi:hypothetical protein
VPEALKPRRIEISSGAGQAMLSQDGPRTIEGKPVEATEVSGQKQPRKAA